MKYGESTFDIIYLLFAVIMGIRILSIKGKATARLAGIAVLTLGIGDAFHLIPRVINYFSSADLTAWLGIGKFVTSITMTVFYLLLYRLWLITYGEKENRKLTAGIYTLVALRVILCLFPQNGWLQNDSSALWGIIRNIPFVALGLVVILLFYKKRNEVRRYRSLWLLITLSFLFYIPVAVAAGIVPMLGMLMLPKTICYMIMIWLFWKKESE